MIPRFEPTASLGEILSFLAGCARPGTPEDSHVRELETRFAEMVGCAHAVFVPSGRMALHLILHGLDLPAGAEVVLPAFTFFAVPAVVRHAGFVPVYADVDPETCVLTPDTVQAVLTERTRAVVPTHLFGRTCDMDGLAAVCASRDIALIEDCAQSCGAEWRGRRTGQIGRAASFTFGITKNFTTFSGGMAVTADDAAAARIRAALTGFAPASRRALLKQGLTALAMRAAAWRPAFNLTAAPALRAEAARGPDVLHRAFEEKAAPVDDAVMRRLRWRPVDVQGRAGLRQLATLDAKNAARRERGRALLRLLRERGCGGLPAPPPAGGDNIYMSFPIRRGDRFRFIAGLRRGGVDVAPGYMTDCAARPELNGAPGRCPHSAEVDREIIHLPLYPGLSERDLARIADAVARTDRALGA